MIDIINKVVAPLRARVMNMIARAVVQRADDSKRLQLLQLGVLDGETRGDLERFQQYGFTSVPLEGAEAVVLFVAGRRDHGLVVAVDDRRFRPKNLQPGEVALYDQNGTLVVCKVNGDLEVTPASGKTVINGSDVELAGNGDAALKGDSYVSAESTFLTALKTYADAIQSVADPSGTATTALEAAIVAFKSAGAAAKSGKVKLG
jgi:phage baseplate assembly protein V